MKNLFALIICIFSYLSLNAQDAKMAEVDSIFSKWSKPDSPGCALGIIQDGKLIYAKGYGMANLEYDIPNSATSVFRIGSTSKQFTAACIVLLVEKGKLNLDDTLEKFFPDFPDYASKITIRHLLNHTSGIRDYLTISSLKGLGDDDYYTDESIMKWLINQTSLNFDPGEEFVYSNSGYWLLGQIVGQVAEMNMADFAQKEIFEPLSMTNTHFHNNHNEIVKKRASGYRPMREGGYRISMTTLDMIGDGGIFTSIEDIKKWDDAFYNSSVLSKDFWKMMTEQGKLNNGEVLDYASGLFIDTYKGLSTVSHGGAFVGFRADLLRFPEQRFSVAIFANRGDANPSRMAFQVADVFLKDKYEEELEEEIAEDKTSSAALVAFTLDQMVGNYELEPGANLEVTKVGEELHVVQTWNKAAYNIVKVSTNTFEIPENTSVKFVFSDLKEDAIEMLTVVQGSRETECKRKDKVDLSGINLEDYVGVYYSKELEEEYHVSLEEETLQVSVRNNAPRALDAYEKDQFFAQGGLYRFSRTNGKITGLDIDVGRVKNLKFVKQ